MPAQYYIRIKGTVRGPYTAEKLKELARRGQFSRVYHVSADGVNWEPASKHPELLPEAKAVKIRKQRIEPEPEEDSGYELAEEPPAAKGQVNPPAPDKPQRSDAWYYASSGQEIGPVSFGELRQQVLRGALRYNDPVWTEGMTDWMEALSVPGLFDEPGDGESPGVLVDVHTPAGRARKSARSPLLVPAVLGGIVAAVAAVLLVVALVVWQSSQAGTTPSERMLSSPAESPLEPQLEEACGAVAACGGCWGCFGVAVVCSIAVLALNIALLVWVARDAKARGMDSAVLWMLLVMFTGVLGLIIFLFSRPQGNLLSCPSCGNKRLQASARCPHCGNA